MSGLADYLLGGNAPPNDPNDPNNPANPPSSGLASYLLASPAPAPTYAPPPVTQPGGGAYAQILGSAPVQAVSNSWVGQHIINPSISFLGKALQPLAAPQQLLFGGLSSVADLISGNPNAALEDWNRSSKAALSYATWGGYSYGGKDPRQQSIMGYDLLKKVGAPEQVAKWGGVGADFLLDVPLLGAAGKATGLSKAAAAGARGVERAVQGTVRGVGRGLASMTANIALGARITSYFDSAADYAVYAGRVASSPFTTQPIKNLVEGAPSSLQGAVSGVAQRILNSRINVPRNQSLSVGPSVGETLIGQNFNIPGPIADAQRLGAHLESQYTVLMNNAVSAFEGASKGLKAADKTQLDTLMGRLTDASDPTLRATLEGQIQALETRTGKTGLYDQTMTAVGKGISFDVWSAENLGKRGLMSQTAVDAYKAGDARHLRRQFAMYGEQATQQIERLAERNLPGAIHFDDPKLEGWFGQVLQGQGIQSSTASQWAGAFKAAYNSTDVHPAQAMKSFLENQGVIGGDLEKVLEGIGNRYAQDLGIAWKPSDRSAALYFRDRQLSGGLQGSSGGKGGLSLGNNPTTITARTEITPEYADLLGEIESFTERIQKQAGTVGKLVSRTGVVQDIRKYLTDNDLIQVGTVDNLHSVLQNAGLRTITESMAEALGQGFQKGEMIPANIHRILNDSTRVTDPGALSAAWQWASSRWQGAKLANPSSILTNVKSAFVMADQYGLSLPKLLGGMKDYLALHRGAMKSADGALDTTVKVNGIAMREIFDAGVTHNTLFQREVTDNASRMLESLGNNTAGGIPQAAAAIQNWLQTPVGAAVGGAYGVASKPLKWMGDLYGRTDSLFKGGAYMMLRKQGRSAEDASKIADEVFFNYEQGLPYAVDFLRGKNNLGVPISPFASFKFLAAGRFIKNLYERPYETARYYRIPSSLSADQTPQEQTQTLAASPGFVKNGLFVFAGKDSEGRTRAIKLDDLLPESVLSDLFNGDNVTGMEPPGIGIARQILSGQGYQGAQIFKGGANLQDTLKANPQEAIRGVVKALWQFGASPLAPGQASTERLIKSLVSRTVPLEQIPDPKVQAAMKMMADGPAAAFNKGVVGVDKQGVQAVPDLVDALLRYVSVKTTLVTPTSSQPGSALSNLKGIEAQIKLLDSQMTDELRQAVQGPAGDGQRREIQARYARMRQPFIDHLQQTAKDTRAP